MEGIHVASSPKPVKQLAVHIRAAPVLWLDGNNEQCCRAPSHPRCCALCRCGAGQADGTSALTAALGTRPSLAAPRPSTRRPLFGWRACAAAATSPYALLAAALVGGRTGGEHVARAPPLHR